MEKLIEEIAELIRTTEPLEEKEWFELSFSYGVWRDGKYRENEIEWVASHVFGESRDEISRQYNFFGKIPLQAVEKLLESIKKVGK